MRLRDPDQKNHPNQQMPRFTWLIWKLGVRGKGRTHSSLEKVHKMTSGEPLMRWQVSVQGFTFLWYHEHLLAKASTGKYSWAEGRVLSFSFFVPTFLYMHACLQVYIGVSEAALHRKGFYISLQWKTWCGFFLFVSPFCPPPPFPAALP